MVEFLGVVDFAARPAFWRRVRSTITEMRSQSSISSARSDDTTRTPVPSRDGLPDHAVDLLARADVDADRGLIEQQHTRPWIIPFSEHDLLLVAAG